MGGAGDAASGQAGHPAPAGPAPQEASIPAAGDSAVAACLLFLFALSQVRARAAELAAGLPVIGDIIRWRAQVDSLWAWAEEHTTFREVLAAATDRGYTVRIHRVLADPTQTTLIYTIEGPQPFSRQNPPALAHRFLVDGQPFELSRRYAYAVEDGVLIMAEEMAPSPSTGRRSPWTCSPSARQSAPGNRRSRQAAGPCSG